MIKNVVHIMNLNQSYGEIHIIKTRFVYKYIRHPPI